MNPRFRRSNAQVVIGLFVIGWGVLMTLSSFGLLARGWMGYFAGFWPLFLVFFGFGKMFTCNKVPGRVFGGFLGIVGLIWTAEHAFNVRIHLWHWWPIVIVAVGVLLVMRAWDPDWPASRLAAASAGGPGGPNPGRELTMFSGLQRRIAEPDYRGTVLTTIMGGVDIDLRGSTTATGEAVIDLLVILGGVQIKVPPDWAVINQVTPILGGVEDKSTGGKDAQHRLIVRGQVIVGGVDIGT